MIVRFKDLLNEFYFYRQAVEYFKEAENFFSAQKFAQILNMPGISTIETWAIIQIYADLHLFTCSKSIDELVEGENI